MPFEDLPDHSLKDKEVIEFLKKYYHSSNHPSAHDDYTDLFTSDGEFIMNSKKSKGKKEIRDLRAAIWSHVPGRDHSPLQIYTHGDDEYDLMIHGDVSYNHHHGHQTGSDWAAKMKLAKEGGAMKVKYYQIIVDSAAHV